MEQREIDNRDYELWVIFAQANYAIAKARHRELLELGTTQQRLGILFILKYAEEPIIPAEMARLLAREPHSVFTVLKKMEDEGLITTSRDLPRRNQVRIAITDKGEQLYRQSRESRVVIGKILACLSEEERSALCQCVEKLRNRSFEELGLRQLPYP